MLRGDAWPHIRIRTPFPEAPDMPLDVTTNETAWTRRRPLQFDDKLRASRLGLLVVDFDVGNEYARSRCLRARQSHHLMGRAQRAAASPMPIERAVVLATFKTRPGSVGAIAWPERRPILIAAARVGVGEKRPGRRKLRWGRTEEDPRRKKGASRPEFPFPFPHAVERSGTGTGNGTPIRAWRAGSRRRF